MPTSPVEVVLIYSTGLVAFCLAVSGVAKLTRTTETLRAMFELRLPKLLICPSFARLLPVVELVIAIGLLTLPGLGRAAVAGVAAAVLTFFTSLLVRALRRGEALDCNCFGSLSADPRITWWSVFRNVALILAAISVAVLGWRSATFIHDVWAASSATLLTCSLAWTLTTVVVIGRENIVLRRLSVGRGQYGSSTPPATRGNRTPAPLSPTSITLGIDPRRPGEVSMGDPIPAAELVTDGGQTRTLRDLGNGRPTLLIFLSAECSSCGPVAQEFGRWVEQLPGIAVIAATSSDPAVVLAKYPQLSGHARYGSRATLAALGVQRSPAAVLLGGYQHPVIASPIAYGVVEIEGLVSSIRDLRSANV